MVTDEMIEAGCKARHGRSWKRVSEKPDMHAWATSHRAEMQAILEAALSAAPVAQEPVAWQMRKRSHPSVGWTNWFDISNAEKEYWQAKIAKGETAVELRALYAGIPPATSAALGADEIARSMRGYLDKLEYQPTGRDPKNTGFSFAKIPDRQLRQWLEKIERRPLGEVLIDCLKKIGVDE